MLTYVILIGPIQIMLLTNNIYKIMKYLLSCHSSGFRLCSNVTARQMDGEGLRVVDV